MASVERKYILGDISIRYGSFTLSFVVNGTQREKAMWGVGGWLMTWFYEKIDSANRRATTEPDEPDP
jgi:hypothetical protein